MAPHRALIKKSPLAAWILDFFVEYMDKSNAIVCSYNVLQEVSGYKRSSVAPAVKVLKDDKWVQAIKVGTANAYVVNSVAYWTTYANGKQYSQFHATILAAATEQDANTMSTVKLKRVPIWDKQEERLIVGPDDGSLPPPDQKDLDLD